MQSYKGRIHFIGHKPTNVKSDKVVIGVEEVKDILYIICFEASLLNKSECLTDTCKYFQCQVCGEQVVDKYLTYKDLPICEKDFRRVGHVCSVCDEIILDRVCMVEGVVMCEKDYQELVSTWPCSMCGKEIPSGK